MQNEHYDTFERYLDALGAALQVEYEAIVAAGFLLQLDCPDLALERHTSYRDRPLADFVGFVEAVVAAINKALRNIPPDKVRLHVCWGNYEGPHDRDVALRDIWPAILQGEGRRVLPAVRQSAPCARVQACSATCRCEDDQLLIAGVIDTLTNFVEHPEVVADRIERIAAVVGTRARARRDRLRLRHLGRHGPRRRGRRVGEAARAARWRAACVEEVV